MMLLNDVLILIVVLISTPINKSFMIDFHNLICTYILYIIAI